jgi:hypothetical protein
MVSADSSIGRFKFADFIALMIFVPIIIGLVTFMLNKSYVLTNKIAVESGVNISYFTERQYQTAVAFDDLSFLIYAILNIGVLLAALSIPVDRDSAPMVFLLFFLFGMIMFMVQDWVVSQFDSLMNKITSDPESIPLVNTPKIEGAIRILPILTMVIAIVMMYMRTTRDRYG